MSSGIGVLPETKVSWAPQPGPQTAFVQCHWADEIFFGGSRGGGKEQPTDELVLTPTGWKEIGTLKVGSKLCATDGTITEVIGVHPRGVRDVYRVTMSDGGWCEAGLDHNWLAWEANKSRKLGNVRKTGIASARKYTTRQIMERMSAPIRRKSYATRRFAIPLPEPVTFNVAGSLAGRGKFIKRPIDPYLLGLLLGDGCITSDCIRVASADPEIGDYLHIVSGLSVASYEREGTPVLDYRFLGDFRKKLVASLTDLKLFGHGAKLKFVPRNYLYAGVDERRAILQGLMDTDGWVEPKRAAYFASISKRLANDVCFLAQSLGCVASVTEKNPSFTYRGEKRVGQKAYCVRIKSPEPETLFRLTRKRKIARTIKHQTDGRWIEKIEKVRRAECVCIAVAHPNSLYITRDFIVTHNTDAACGKLLIKALHYGQGMRGIFFRRTYKQLEEVIIRAKELYSLHGAAWKESSMTFTFPNAATIKMRYLDRDADADNYQGHQYTDLVIEEAGSFPDPAPIMKLKATLRSAKGVPCQMLLTGNPGGVGSHWIRARYIDPCPTGWMPIREVEERKMPDGQVLKTERTRIYIPSRVTDNKVLLEKDPNYIARLMESGSEQLVRAWLDGDFYAIDGAFFDCWDQRRHVLPYTDLPPWWLRFRAMDWGSAKPFSVHWIAMASEDWTHPVSGTLIPKGALIVYREWYGVKMRRDGTIQANVGLKLVAEQVADGILAREPRGERIDYGVLDPSAFAVDGGISIAERMARHTAGKLMFRRADNRRSGSYGSLSGWDQVRSRLIGEENERGERVPMLYVFATCNHLIRTLPMMQHDPDKPEDLQSDSEDHACDALRYGLMSRPYTRPAPAEKQRMTTIADVTLEQLWLDHDADYNSRDDQRI